ncbi:MAG: sugar phosphate nucleotidyltransferase, partial [Bryobacteraceae bacterium]
AVERFIEGRSYAPVQVETIIEPEPLGTAGAVAFARQTLRSDPVLIMNGDSWMDADLSRMLAFHQSQNVAVTMLCARVPDAGRYGRLELDCRDRIVRFIEKDRAFVGSSWINAGAYLVSRSVLDRICELRKGSLERDVFEAMPSGQIAAFQASGSFLDIGTPESLAAAPLILVTT